MDLRRPLNRTSGHYLRTEWYLRSNMLLQIKPWMKFIPLKNKELQIQVENKQPGMKQNVLKVHPGDNVLVALSNLANGARLTYLGQEYILQEDIPAKHKFFMADMNEGEEVIMYGVLVGKTQHQL